MIRSNIEDLILNHKDNIKIWIVLALIFILITFKLFHTKSSDVSFGTNKVFLEFQNQTRKLFDNYRKICLSKLKKQIIRSVESFSLRNKTALFVDLPDHMNYGDTLIWFN
jgi:hypothetical protein